MEVVRNKNGISILQRKYVLDLLKETGMLECKPCETLVHSNQKLGVVDKGYLVDKGSFQRLLGKLTYLSHTHDLILLLLLVLLAHICIHLMKLT